MLRIPPELLVRVLHYVSSSDLATCGLVERAWAELIQEYYDALWGGRLVATRCAGAVPSERTCHSAVQYKNKMVTIGGMPRSDTISGVKNELCVLDLQDWSWRVVSEGIPAVTEHTTVLYDGSIFLYGGYYAGEERKNYLFKISSLDDTTPAVEQLDEVGGCTPPARSSHTALAYKHQMYVFGGWDRSGENKNDLYALDLQTLRWRMVHGNDPFAACDLPAAPGVPHRPCPRRAHAAFAIGQHMMVFGGTTTVDGDDVECGTAAIDVLDMKAETWELRQVFGDVPCPRSRADGAVYEGVFYLAGGWNRSRPLSDLHCFDPLGSVWRKLAVAAPFGIMQHSVVVWQGRLLMFGGSRDPTADPLRAAAETSYGRTSSKVHILHLPGPSDRAQSQQPHAGTPVPAEEPGCCGYFSRWFPCSCGCLRSTPQTQGLCRKGPAGQGRM
eukprot:TRINITY_DN13733_c0_g2_i1.p1 TRINITY_DN13733_c0_g2~~TRINITY_DN13733_c0_g2_i1.p1  ORF type:complete len:442 (+),score=79.79 TRINITY_DN13733_c0_g2_i1:81-1406(+)